MVDPSLQKQATSSLYMPHMLSLFKVRIICLAMPGWGCVNVSTPVLLLCMDWYNLEKSKRVKAFRCGEFDDCIEKAESLQGGPIKKREKYARREDAILHALELEKQQLERKQQKFGNANNARAKLHIGVKKEMGIPLGKLGNNCKLLNLKSRNGLGSSEENTGNSLYAQKPKNVKRLSLQNGKCQTTHRIGGLQDFEQRATSASGCRSIGGASYDCSKNSLLGLKRKRTPVAVIDESPATKHNMHRPPVQVLKSSANLFASNSLHSNGGAASEEKERTGGICRAKRSQYVYLPASPNDKYRECPSDQMEISPSQYETESSDDSSTEDDSSSGLMEGVESDFSERDYLYGDMDEQTGVFSDSVPIDTEPRHFGRLVNNYRSQRGSMSSEELECSAFTTQVSHLRSRDQISAGNYDGVSKWQLKGKRNSRSLMKRPVEMDSSICNGFRRGSHFEGRGSDSSSQRALRQGFYHGEDDFGYDYDGGDLIDKNSMHNQAFGFGKRYQPMFDSDDGLVWGMDGLSHAPLRRYWDESEECYDPIYGGHRFGNRRKSKLVDVDLRVQASSCQGEHVPLVSLMSRLNGKAIIGHPVQVEIIEDGSTDLILSRNNHFYEEYTEKDGSTALTPVWRTARRTVMHRIPHPHPSKSFEKKYPKNLLEKVNLSSQKTRTLSSIPTQQKFNMLSNQKSMSRLSKAEDDGLATITCIPVKLAFSRLMEAVGRPPSRTANPTNDDIERRQS
ncbi:hypothetical protein MKW94_019471 [Papaver nudicaule]|uniref:Uncharacterized protein n=1 Tax=Papaver nudicaule TaxID=74823 RepID=A0AA41S9V3_PAPNU|nr:hypothetical protein [Papaver nudicaule]